ncbi:TrkH family potassium uptake protein [Eubacterium oxidoreducens]|nr:TrkH family potassium uptake protein [Eubacterium oxidoreducens]
MNRAIIRYFTFRIIQLEAVLLLVPCLVALIYQEPQGWYYLGTSIACGIVGTLGSMRKVENDSFYAKESFVVVALCWIVISAIGAVPFTLSGEIPNYLDALFENVSGFTTTGASILTDVEALSHTALFMRSFIHWVGGMGVLVLMLAILPRSSGNNMYLMRAESPGPSVGKLVPQIRKTAGLLYKIYIVITVFEIGALIWSKMPVFDAVTISVATTGTGGFAILNSSIGAYTIAQQNIITVFMFVSGVNFSFYYFLLFRKVKNAAVMEEVRWYLGIFVGSVVLICANAYHSFDGMRECVHHVAFTVSSILTSTGFATVDYTKWPEFSQTLLVFLMLIGACAGSTGGGMKVSRWVLMFKAVRNEISYLIHPRRVRQVRMDGHVVPKETMKSLYSYVLVYFFIFAGSVIVIAIDNYGFDTNFSAVAACLNNIGPGIGEVGPSGNYSGFSNVSKIVLMLDMLAGRLELFPLLMLIAPTTWRR